MNLKDIKKLNLPAGKAGIPNSPGCYQFLDKKGDIIYIGKAANLKSRVSSYWRASANHSPVKKEMMKQIAGVRIIETDSEIEALLLEANLIKKHQPDFNVVMRDDKRHVYIKISLADEIPGVFLTRKIDKTGKYFGPFTSAEAVKQTLKIIRKIWPYCTERKIKSKPCFYYQINRCLGICAGIIGREEYMKKVIKPIVLFLEGKKGRVITNYELRIKNLKNRIEKLKTKKERLSAEKEKNNLEFQLKNIKQVLENARVLGVAEKYAADEVELAKVLGLKKIPQRIEGYDIANIFGREATGSMVVFSHGEPDKNEYRKFKIKTDNKADDTGMLKEVLERRLRHTSPASRTSPRSLPLATLSLSRRGCRSPELFGTEAGEVRGAGGQIMNRKDKMATGKEKFEIENLKLKIKEKWPLPNLIIVDGGKGQLNACLSVLKKNKLDIDIVSISKGEGLRSAGARDKIFFPKEKKPLELPLASPALHLIKRVRDEAHRFAIGYHKKLRRKKFFK